MVKKNPLSIFKGSQGNMYAVVILVWQNYLSHLKDFQKKNTTYTEQLGKDQIEATKTARDMPDVIARREPSKEALASLAAAAKNCTNNWQSLSALIEKSFSAEDWQQKKDVAGYANYEIAASGAWDKVIDLNNMASGFIAANTEALTVGGMPAAFPGEYEGFKTAYTGLYDSLYITRFNFQTETTEKATANNTVFAAAMSMMTDARQIYRNDARTRAAFTYGTLMKSVRGKGFTKTGVTFTVLTPGDDDAQIPVTNATATFSSVGKPCPANEKGKIKCELSEGTYNYTITAPGLISIIGTITIKGGTMHQRKLVVKKSAALSDTPLSSATISATT